MVVFETFKLYELKDILVYIKTRYGLMGNFSQYNVNKYDLIVILRNSGYFDETKRTYLHFNYKNNNIEFKPDNINKLYRGLKTNTMTKENKVIILSFL